MKVLLCCKKPCILMPCEEPPGLCESPFGITNHLAQKRFEVGVPVVTENHLKQTYPSQRKCPTLKRAGLHPSRRVEFAGSFRVQKKQHQTQFWGLMVV